MGEIRFKKKTLVEAINTTLQKTEQTAAEQSAATPGGRFHVFWDEGGSATTLGQLPFFAEFLEVSGLFTRWVDGCPMDYTSSNAPKVVDVLGTPGYYRSCEVIQPGIDTGARWVKKGGKSVFGYKQHTLVNNNGLVLAVETTAANQMTGDSTDHCNNA
ncbi:transposase [Nitrosomonas sp.]|uniref:transposase n=1 Tax=Nitrosomonas sp. TaxID=42353 RepID=UPI0025D0E203|nr:transposase [Nitrosomonas sp.]MBY0483963.1 transposase [Nitrosomonas sp.]